MYNAYETLFVSNAFLMINFQIPSVSVCLVKINLSICLELQCYSIQDCFKHVLNCCNAGCRSLDLCV